MAYCSKESACNARDTGDMGLIPESGRSPGSGHGTLLHILAWEIPWTEEPGRLGLGVKKSPSDMTGHIHANNKRSRRLI